MWGSIINYWYMHIYILWKSRGKKDENKENKETQQKSNGAYQTSARCTSHPILFSLIPKKQNEISLLSWYDYCISIPPLLCVDFEPITTTGSLLPNIQYCTPKNASQAAWNNPHILKLVVTFPLEPKRKPSLKQSPTSHEARTDRRKPLQERFVWFERICGMGRTASTVRPIAPRREMYVWELEMGGRRIWTRRRAVVRYTRNCQYLTNCLALLFTARKKKSRGRKFAHGRLLRHCQNW